MSFQKVTIMALGVILIISSFHVGDVDGVRLCGKRLADLLNFICEKHGGFHTPRDRRDVLNRSFNKRTVIEGNLRHPSRRSESGATSETAEESTNDGELAFAFQSGIVDECCKKPCSLSTMISYCANVQQVNIDLEDIVSTGTDNLTQEDLDELEYQQISTDESSADENGNLITTQNDNYSNRPNLGLSNRNRPVFIVLSQTQDDDRTLGEYRF